MTALPTTAKRFLDDAHKNGHRGPAMLRRWAMHRNQSRRIPYDRVTSLVLAEAIRLEEEEKTE